MIVKAVYDNLSTFVGCFFHDPRIVDPAGEGEDIFNEDSIAINSSLYSILMQEEGKETTR
jgi:hypothetical protein